MSDPRPATTAKQPQPPPNIQGYQILGPLGPGRTRTWRALHAATKQQVALKVMDESYFPTEQARARFQKKTLVSDFLDHPAIAKVYETGLQSGQYFCAMELIEGVSIDKYVEENRLNVKVALALMQEAADAVGHAHQTGIIHGGLRPASVLIDKGGRPRVIGFGLTKVLAGGNEEKAGTLHVGPAALPYISPEQAMGWEDRIDRRTDVYSLGVLLYQLTVGQLPFRPQVDSLPKIAKGEFSPPREVNSAVEQDLEAVILKAMAREAAQRYDTGKELAQDIKSYLRGDPVAAREQTSAYIWSKRIGKATGKVGGAVGEASEGLAPFAPRLKKPLMIAGAALVVLLIGYFAVGWWNERSRQRVLEERRAKVAAILDEAEANATKEKGAIGLAKLDEAAALDGSNPRLAAIRAKIEKAMGPKPGTLITNSLGMKLAFIPEGAFTMGSPESDPDRRPDETPHRVRITRGFYIGATEVTRKQFEAFVAATKYVTDPEKAGGASWKSPGFDQGGEDPVVRVTWHDAVAFCNWLSREERKPYRLPTEAEWEYAARAGTATPFPWGATIAEGRGFANVGDASYAARFTSATDAVEWLDGFVNTSPASTFKPNAWGLFDVIGNAAEWCSDGYAPYGADEAADPRGDRSSETRVVRGASWNKSPGGGSEERSPGAWYRTAARYRIQPTDAWDNVGFRVVMEGEAPEP